MNRLLVEIGTEEIPAGYIQPALASFSSGLIKKLSDARIEYGHISTFGTPRRLTLIVDDVAKKHKSVSTETMGPPERIALDDSGNLTIAGQKFAEKMGVQSDQLTIKDTNKGRYLCAVKTERGIASKIVLKDMLPQLILSVHFPKTMRWANLKIQFARPIHNIVAMLGREIIPFHVGNVKSGRYTFGHRFMKPGKIKLTSSDQYLDSLESSWVLADINQRKEKLVWQLNEAVPAVDGQVLNDDELVDTVSNLIEYPVAVVGSFDKAFLELPREILITAMREHQKYFAVVDRTGNLMPYFVAINNTLTKDMGLVAKGHERVLRARLADAQFFFNTDLKNTPDSRVDQLKSVLFQANLGSMYDKTKRVEKISAMIAESLNMNQNQIKEIVRAAQLCKTDLISQVVIEFPKLQGVMGRVYADAQQESQNVSAAIEEHYLPSYSGGRLPETDFGSVLSIADKIDTICACFSIGLIPTGASDPYALRRQGIGIVQIALEKQFTFSLPDMIASTLKLFGRNDLDEIKHLSGQISDFLKGRMAHLLEEDGVSKDAVAAVLSVANDHIPNIWKKARSLQRLKSQPDFEILAIAFKRVVNIIKKADADETVNRDVDISLFDHASEIALFEKFNHVNQNVKDLLKKGEIDNAFTDIASMRGIVDQFFDDVMVMTEDINIRKNRLALLGQISGLFELLADFSKIST